MTGRDRRENMKGKGTMSEEKIKFDVRGLNFIMENSTR